MLNTTDLFSRFPNLYVPADFVKIDVDWGNINYFLGFGGEVINKLIHRVPLLHEANPTATTSTVTNTNNQTMFTLIKVPTNNNTVIGSYGVPISNNDPHLNEPILQLENMPSHNYYRMVEMPVKFNVRVIISCGMKELDERLDHTVTRKLR